MIYDFLIIRIIVQNEVNASLFSCRVQFWFFLQLICDHSSGQMCPGLVVTCFFRQSSLNPHAPWWIFCSAAGIVSHRSNFQAVTYRHPCSNNHRWSPFDVHQSLFFCLSLNINEIQRYRIVVLPISGISHNTSEILSRFNIWS